jgi:hypothetical protein
MDPSSAWVWTPGKSRSWFQRPTEAGRSMPSVPVVYPVNEAAERVASDPGGSHDDEQDNEDQGEPRHLTHD